jgi:hypothetical protein
MVHFFKDFSVLRKIKMLQKIRGKLIWLGLGVTLATWLSYEYSEDLVYSLTLGAVALMVGLMVLGFYSAGQTE